MGEAVFQCQHRVIYAECTAGNHVYYSRYLDILEGARGEFFRHLGAPLLQWQEQSVAYPVIECRVQYKRPARYDDMLTIEVWPVAFQRVWLNFGHRILDQSGTVIVEAETFHVCTGLDEKPRRIPESLAQLLQPYLRAATPPK